MTWQDFVTMAGGLGLFMFGMKMMGDELERAAGNSLRHFLEILTRNRFLGMVVGIVFTILVQSSSASTVMVVGFVNAGLMDLFQAAGVITGANIGATITAQLIAFKLTDVAPGLIFIGVLFIVFGKKAFLRQLGGIIAGFGILFLGMDLMSSPVSKLKEMPEVTELFTTFGKKPLLGIIVGVVITAIIQSSGASIGILQLLAEQGLITLESSIFIVLGAKIGTCATAMLSSIGTGKNARRTALLHLLFNVVNTTVCYFIFRLLPATEWISALSPNSPMRQIANAHVITSLIGAALFFPFINQFVGLVNLIIPGQDESATEMQLQYLNEPILKTPPAAVAAAIKELKRMLRISRDNLEMAMYRLISGRVTEDESTVIENREEQINFLQHEITRYLVLINQTELSEHEATLVGALFHAVNDVERIGDHSENLLEYAQVRTGEKVPISDAALAELQEMFDGVQELLDMTETAFDHRDDTRSAKAYAIEQRVDDLADVLQERHIERLNQGLCTPRSGALFSDTITNLERVADHAINIINASVKD